MLSSASAGGGARGGRGGMVIFTATITRFGATARASIHSTAWSAAF